MGVAGARPVRGSVQSADGRRSPSDDVEIPPSRPHRLRRLPRTAVPHSDLWNVQSVSGDYDKNGWVGVYQEVK